MSRPGAMRSTVWIRLLAIAIASTVAIDATLLTFATGLVTGGFGAPSRPSLASLIEYFAGAAVVDAWLVLVLWLLAHPFLKRFGGGVIRASALSLIIAIAPTTLFAFVTYKIHSVLGGLVRTRFLTRSIFDVSTSSSSIAEAWLPGSDDLILILVAGGFVAVPFAARRFEARRGAQAVRVLRFTKVALAAAAAGILGTAVLATTSANSELLRAGLSQKASGKLLHLVVAFVTDWDRDGWGWLSLPPDPDPVDSAIHPYAIEIPGNGVDENGVGGDLPKRLFSDRSPSSFDVAPTDIATAPDVLMIFLEGFRPELLATRIDGKPVAPFLAGLAREGAQSRRAYVHTPWTLQSRDHLFRGRIDEDQRGESLVDALRRRGYFVAHFSGQDDSYGDSATDLGFERSDVFYDARRDVERRTSRTKMAVSLQVSWKTVLSRVNEFLGAHRPDGRPLFLYVNLVDTHFPYTHGELDTIVASPEMPRSAIRIENAPRIFRTYANTAANVDRGIAKLVGAWRARESSRRRVLVITGDHGESLYENGTLGHGQSIDSVESRVPLIVQGLDGRWPEPIGISEIADLLLSHLANEADAPAPELVPDPDKRIFQYLGSLAEPELIALRGVDGVVGLDLRFDEAWKLGPEEERLAESPTPEELRALIWTWESLQAASADESVRIPPRTAARTDHD